MTNHCNDERTVHCPVDGCDATPLARGINLHLRQSSGEGHGQHGEVPDHVSTENLETVGNREVEMDYPEQRDSEQVTRICPYCSRPFEGKNGVLIHLSHVAGRKNHPENADEGHSEGDFPVVEIDSKGNITSVAGESQEYEAVDFENGAVPVQRVYHLIAELLSENRQRAAKQTRRLLLGTEPAGQPRRNAPPHIELHEALLSRRYTESAEDEMSAILRSDGIRLTCEDHSMLYRANEARDVAAALERALSDTYPHETVSELVEFLRYGSQKLEDEEVSQNYHEEFQEWR
jgi:hypothetical protein